MIQLGVNIDHVATVRQARYPGQPDAGEPDPVRAAHEAELGGADGITIHLREDRRHIQDRDLDLLRRLVKVKVNLEMAATDDMIAIAERYQPHTSMLVPEGRAEVTTEGGLDVAAEPERFRDVVARLKAAGMVVSAFVDADLKQVEAAAAAGFDVCEIHTGPYAEAFGAAGGDVRLADRGPGSVGRAIQLVADAGAEVRRLGMRFNAGHALNYHNVGPIAALPGIEELHIGHAIVSRAVFVGMREAVAQMKALMTGAFGRERQT
ncbi:MAG: pyridoxine 5'-phosphate synthase [Phycisphaerae bacterium]|nr:pyridoxine 5'-phosphate synthase [Phycisphaerae bacterium]